MFIKWLESFNKTEKEDRSYWHVHFEEHQTGQIEVKLKGGKNPVDVSSQLIQ
ncbi:MAG: hypothetical protein ABI612_26470 [Betaproteobacteria bacterium]